MSNADFQTIMKRATVAIEAEMPAVERYIASSFPSGHPLRQEAVRFVLNGGKRFRPALSYLVAEAYGQRDARVHLALETFHKYLLAHDDVIDRDVLRNGSPTVHAKLAQLRGDASDAVHFGNSLAIIAGNLMEAATQRIILETKLPAKTTRSLQLLINQAVNEVTWGWCDQFMMDYEPLDSPGLTQERIEESLIWVTGRYSIKLPLYFGLTVAGQPVPDGLEKFADTAGLLYQTGDDVIGIFGDQQKTGKSNAGDLLQAKKTLPLWFAYQSANSDDKARLMSIVGNPAATVGMLAEAREIIRAAGLPRALQRMDTWQKEAKKQLQAVSASLPGELIEFLDGFIDFLGARDF